MQDQAVRTLRNFMDTVVAGPKLVGIASAIIVSAFWNFFSSLLAWLLGILFFSDMVLGILVDVHKGGIRAFDWEEFWKGGIKMIAAIIGIAVFVAGDMLFHITGMPNSWYPLATAGLLGMCYGFFYSALENLGYFFPKVRNTVEKLILRLKAHDPHEQRRRVTDNPSE